MKRKFSIKHKSGIKRRFKFDKDNDNDYNSRYCSLSKSQALTNGVNLLKYISTMTISRTLEAIYKKQKF